MSIIKLSRSPGSRGSGPRELNFHPHFYLVDKAAKLAFRRYKNIGSFTFDDLRQISFEGFWQCVNNKKYPTHPNKAAYVASFCYGYITHALHRKSRIIRPTYEAIKANVPCYHVPIEVIGDGNAKALADLEQGSLEPYGTCAMRSLANEYLDSLSNKEYLLFEKGKGQKNRKFKTLRAKLELLNQETTCYA